MAATGEPPSTLDFVEDVKKKQPSSHVRGEHCKSRNHVITYRKSKKLDYIMSIKAKYEIETTNVASFELQ